MFFIPGILPARFSFASIQRLTHTEWVIIRLQTLSLALSSFFLQRNPCVLIFMPVFKMYREQIPNGWFRYFSKIASLGNPARYTRFEIGGKSLLSIQISWLPKFFLYSLSSAHHSNRSVARHSHHAENVKPKMTLIRFSIPIRNSSVILLCWYDTCNVVALLLCNARHT